MHWQCLHRRIDLSRPAVMGVLNVTPDSFSDGGRFLEQRSALERVERMVKEGAAIIDVGGESTRPGSLAISEHEEIERVVPVIRAVAESMDVAISVDTCKPAVMRAAVEAGACIVNDITALHEESTRRWAAEAGVGVCLMHMQGEPRTMQQHPYYNDVVAEVGAFLAERREACLAAGIRADAIVLDPGLGFGKTMAHNLALLKATSRLAALSAPLLLGVSRKSFIGRVLGREVDDRMYGGLGLAAFAVGAGARIIRTHDVGATLDAVRMVSAVLEANS
jgi:dihydropteroate synthase